MGFSKYSMEDIQRIWNEIERGTLKYGESQTKETVDHPSHYNREGGMECLDEMELVFGKEVVMNFCLCNAWKYRYRAADKNGEEDLKKSDWYLKKYKELKEGKNTTTVTIPKGYHSVNTMLGTVTVKDVLGKND